MHFSSLMDVLLVFFPGYGFVVLNFLNFSIVSRIGVRVYAAAKPFTLSIGLHEPIEQQWIP